MQSANDNTWRIPEHEELGWKVYRYIQFKSYQLFSCSKVCTNTVHVFVGKLIVPQPLFSLLLLEGFDGLMDDEMCITLPYNSELEMKQDTVMHGVLLLPFMNTASCSSQACLLQRKWLPLLLNNWYATFLCQRKYTGVTVSRKAESLAVVLSALCFVPYKYPLIF